MNREKIVYECKPPKHEMSGEIHFLLELARLISWVVIPLVVGGALIWMMVWVGGTLLFSLAGASVLIVPAILVFLCSFVYPLFGGGRTNRWYTK